MDPMATAEWKLPPVAGGGLETEHPPWWLLFSTQMPETNQPFSTAGPPATVESLTGLVLAGVLDALR